ncbi:MAG: hypothetical protein JRD19_06655 [Deltaproteobacteria bacterium]|jgi:hypothetical protein|nr:hypothetical protein [Deltaproteobacteria bacterium]
MFKDYSGGRIMISGRNKIITPRRKRSILTSELIPGTRLVWKTVSAMLLLTLVIGISSTVWYGLQVKVALDQIGRGKETNNTLYNENKLLVAQRDLMLTTDHMKEAAKKLRLVSPSENQLRYR